MGKTLSQDSDLGCCCGVGTLSCVVPQPISKREESVLDLKLVLMMNLCFFEVAVCGLVGVTSGSLRVVFADELLLVSK